MHRPGDRDEASAIRSLLQRVILPRSDDPTVVRPLYVDESGAVAGGQLRQVEPEPEISTSVGDSPTTTVASRTSASLPARGVVSFATYFNGFAAGYWRYWSRLAKVHLRLSVEGAGSVEVYRSRESGAHVLVHREEFDPAGCHELDLELDLRPFADGGWYWFDLTAGSCGLVLVSGGWYASAEGSGRAAVLIGIPTFDRPADCVATLTAIGADAQVMAQVGGLVVVDQGTRKVRDEPGFVEASLALGDKLRVIDQSNLGGSGGYARVMKEAIAHTDCEQILLMDDDTRIEPDSILRAVAFSRFARSPMLVGAQMLLLEQRSQLYAMGEVLDHESFTWRVAPGTEPHHDFAARTLRRTPFLHRRVSVDYSPWWMCLMPRSVIEQVGLPLPLFISWDDIEYGLRARAGGFPSAAVPGIAIWHMSHAAKDGTRDWQSYFRHRNRYIAAALHGPESPRRLLATALARTARNLARRNFSAVAIQTMAVDDFLAGPEGLFPGLPTVFDDVRARCAELDERGGHSLGLWCDQARRSLSRLYEVGRRWKQLRRDYAAALPELTSEAAWTDQIFAAEPSTPPTPSSTA